MSLVTPVNQGPLTITSTNGSHLFPLVLTVSGGSSDGTVNYVATNGTATGCTVSATAPYTLSSSIAGTCSVTATMTGNPAYLPVSSPPAVVTLSAPTLATQQYVGPVGTKVTDMLTGFEANQSVTLHWGTTTGTALGTVTTSTTGSATKVVYVPSAVFGNHAIYAVGSGGPTATAVFNVLARLVLAPPIGPVGASVTAILTGFEASQSVTLHWHTTTGAALGTVTTSTTGSASKVIHVPSAALGNYQDVYAVGSGGPTAPALFNVTAPLALTPGTGPVGSSVTATLTGFKASQSVTLHWGSATGTALGTVTIRPIGSANKLIYIPSAALGNHAIYAVGSGGPTVTAVFNVTAKVALAPAVGPVGSSVTATLTGFKASQSVTLHWGSATGTALGTVTTSTTGSASKVIHVPSAALGNHAIYAVGSGGPTNTAVFKIT